MSVSGDISDQKLVEAHRGGDAGAFRLLVYRHRQAMYAFIHHMVGKDAPSDDLFQEIFLKIFNNIERYEDRGTFKSWMFGIANNACIDHLRRTRRYSRTFIGWERVLPGQDGDTGWIDFDGFKSDHLPPDKLLELQEFRTLVARAIERLPVVQREVFLLRHHAELSFQEIATALGRPLNTVLGQMRSSLLSLRSVLREHYEYEPFNR